MHSLTSFLRAFKKVGLISFCIFLAAAVNIAQAQPRKPSTCLAVADGSQTLPIMKASFTQAKSHLPEVEIKYVGHSNFRIISPEGIIIETDFAGISGKGRLPDAVTMNHAHTSHFTNFIPEGIKVVLKGWGEKHGEGADHYVTLGDVLIRNVPTDIYRGGILTEPKGNSIFIFEVAGLCIGHLGHMHHTLTPELIAQIGRLDIVMVPVDGGATMSAKGMADIVKELRSSMIIPMHWLSSYSQGQFLAEMGSNFQISGYPVKSLKVSLNNLPQTPTVVGLIPENPRNNSLGLE